jgi:hypothetical protein
MLRPTARTAALREHPTMQRDTYILAGATLLPFLVVVPSSSYVGSRDLWH